MVYFFKEYPFENGKKVSLESMHPGFVPKELYQQAHASLPIICADILIKYQGGYLLVRRKNDPAREEIWALGGRLERGLLTPESIKRKVKAECGLDIRALNFVGFARHFFATSPFQHGKGTDTPTLMFTAKGSGNLKLDNLHDEPIILKKDDYTAEFRKRLHPYMKDFLDLVYK